MGGAAGCGDIWHGDLRAARTSRAPGLCVASEAAEAASPSCPSPSSTGANAARLADVRGQLGGQQMVRSLAAANGLAVVVGPAGSGKTAALAAAGRIWTDQERPAIGAAVAAITARRLEHATGIPSMSLARLLAAARRTDPATGRMTGLARGAVVVVDEASMLDTRTLAMLLAHTGAADGTLVLVGDPAQLPEIGAGGLFTALALHDATITLADNRRQTEEWERRALADLRAGDPDAAVAAYADHNRIHIERADQLPDRIAGDYLRLRAEKESVGRSAGFVEPVAMLAVRRTHVTELNDTTRARLLEAGRLGPNAVTAGAGDRLREYRAGDRVLVTANDYRLGLLNGSFAEVSGVDPQRRTLTLAADDQRHVSVPVEWAAGHLDHGYAMTFHKAQGVTVDIALLYGAGGLTREAGYVGLSRGSVANHIYVAEVDDRQPFPGAGDDLYRLAARLAVRRAQTLAARQLPRLAPDRWRRNTSHQAPPDRIEGIAR
jgi:ATP-dependent exoDNAse (exonuclease V) alpha subunit